MEFNFQNPTVVQHIMQHIFSMNITINITTEYFFIVKMYEFEH